MKSSAVDFFNLLMEKVLFGIKYNLPTKTVSTKSWMPAATRAAIAHNVKQIEKQIFTGSSIQSHRMMGLNTQLNIAAFETLLIKLDILNKRFLF